MSRDQRDDGGPAFPCDEKTSMVFAIFENAQKPLPEEKYIELQAQLQTGMSLRDYFAAKALQGILTNPGWTNRPDQVDGTEAEAAYRHADAMLEARRG